MVEESFFYIEAGSVVECHRNVPTRRRRKKRERGRERERERERQLLHNAFEKSCNKQQAGGQARKNRCC